MVDFFGSLGRTLESLGGAAAAPYGLVWDLATAPFDNKDDDLGSLIDMGAKNVASIFDPLGNDKTWTGFVFGKTMQGLEVAYREGISEPLSTAGTVAGHAAYSRDIDGIFSADTWAQAYQTAQTRSIGQTFAVGAMAVSGNLFNWEDDEGKRFVDPLNPDAYRQAHSTLPAGFTILSGTTDFAARWYLDPGAVIGKGVGAYRNTVKYGKLNNATRTELFERMAEDQGKALIGLPGLKHFGPKVNIQKRTDAYLDFIGGSNVLGRKLNAAEIYAASPELRRAAGPGRAVAGLLEQANILEDPRLIRDAQRRILAVAAGDQSQIARLRLEMDDAGHLADALENIQRGGTLRLEQQALSEVRHDPVFLHDLEAQLSPLNTRGEIDDFVKGWVGNLDSMKQVESHLNWLPGVHRSGNRALKRETGTRKIDALNDALRHGRYESANTVWQKSVNQMPVRVVKTAGFLASPYTKAPVAVADALRQTHYVGVANLHDWNGATTQLDSMMRVAGVDDMTRMKVLGDSFLAKTEADKMRAISNIENISMGALAERFSKELGKSIDRDFIEALMVQGAARRGMHLSALRGRAYAATGMTDDLVSLRGQGMQRAMDGADTAASRRRFSATQDKYAKWRVDQIDDDGVPLALPVLSTQLANSVPLIDIHLAKKVLKEEKNLSRLETFSKAWRQESVELRGMQAELKTASASAAERLSRAIERKQQGMDFLLDVGQMGTRIWKFGVLFRLGYPIRVLMDDHMRIMAQMRYGSFLGQNLPEATSNLGYNQAGRYREARKLLNAAKDERDTLLYAYGHPRLHADEEFDALVGAVKTLRKKGASADEITEANGLISKLDPEGAIASYYHREADILKARQVVSGKKGAITKWRNQIDADGPNPDLEKKIREAERQIANQEGKISFLTEQQPSESPEMLRAQLQALEAQIAKGHKGFLPDKRIVGSREVELGNGLKANGVYGGDYGMAYREASSSSATFDYQISGVEDRLKWTMGTGSHRVLNNSEPGHIDAWVDVLNHQFRMSPEAMFFIKNADATPADFARWVHEPKQRFLRDRVAHYAHDAEDWGHRVKALVDDYVPSQELREILAEGHVSARRLTKMFPDEAARPAVHGQALAVNTSLHPAARVTSDTINKIYRGLGELPTDHLSRHPFFSALYKAELRELYQNHAAAYAGVGRKFTQADVQDLERIARQKALANLKQTLFDMSAHSHAAHMMRLLSPFFAAHQESLARWWRIAQENPAVIRRFQQGFDMPRKLGLVYDSKTGEPVETGEGVSPQHRILIRVPETFGGWSKPVNRWLNDTFGNGKTWSVNENGFNLILQGGLMNPGVGPLVTVPVEALVQKYAEYENIERVARILNPYPPGAPIEAAVPAWAQRAWALWRKEKSGEYAQRWNANMQDAHATFLREEGREPTDAEVDKMMQQIGHETNLDMALMLMQNSLSPNPAKPESKYAAVQHGLNQIREKARVEGRDYDWVVETFKEKFGDIYMAFLYSDSLNPARLTGSRGEVSAIKRHSTLLADLDPKVARMVIGPEAKLSGEEDYTQAGRQWLKDRQMGPGSADTWLSDKSPEAAMLGTMVSNGWSKYAELTGLLTAIAQQQGLTSYSESQDLVRLKSQAVAALKEENFAWGEDYESFDKGKFGRYLNDMRQIVSNKRLLNDPQRTDVAAIAKYLQARDAVQEILDQRRSQGLTYTPEAKDVAPLVATFYQAVQFLVEESPLFEEFAYNGVIEFDPLVAAGREVVEASGNVG